MIDFDGQCIETMTQTKFKFKSLLFLKKKTLLCFECQGHKIAEEANVTNIFQLFYC